MADGCSLKASHGEIFIAYGENKRLENVPGKWMMRAINARSIQITWDSYKDVVGTASYTN